MTCEICGKDHPFQKAPDGITVVSHLDVAPDIKWLCSPSCLVDYAWKLKEGQVKLSKSKEA